MGAMLRRWPVPLEIGVEWLVIEQDRVRDLPPMDSIRVSYENLKRIVG
jgi:hypothetical protein